MPLPRSEERPISPLIDYAKIDPIDPLGNIASPTSARIAAAQPRWLAASTLVISGSSIDALACALAASPLPGGLATTIRAFCAIAAVALIVAYVRSTVAFSRRPQRATQHGMVVVFDLAMAFFGACAMVDVVVLASHPVGPGHDGALIGWAAGCVAIAIGPALAVAYARRKVLGLDLADLAGRGYRADASS